MQPWKHQGADFKLFKLIFEVTETCVHLSRTSDCLVGTFSPLDDAQLVPKSFSRALWYCN